MQYLSLLWDSSQSLSTVGTVLKFISAISGILVLVFRLRESSLRKRADADKTALFAQRITAAEAAFKPRRLTDEQKTSLAKSLKNIATKPKIFMCAGMFDSESVAFGEDIERSLVGAGFDVIFPKGLNASSPLVVSPPGLHIVVKDPKTPNPTAKKIQKCFDAAGIKLPGTYSEEKDFPSDRIEIAVGQR